MEKIPTADRTQDQRFIQMVELHQTALRRMCYMILRDEELTKDAVQETFLKAYRTMRNFRAECNEKTWLMRIAVNTCRDIYRSAWFRHIDKRITPEDLPERTVQTEIESVELTMAIMQLPRDLKEITLLYYYQDMTMREVAETLSISLSTVSKRLNRAQAKLRLLLEGREIHG